MSVLPALATNTLWSDESSATASGPDPVPVDTEEAVPAFDALVPPSLSTLTELLVLLAM